MDFSNDCSNIAVNESDNVVFIYPLDEKGNNALFNYTTYSNSDGLVCKEYSEDSTISDCDLNLITESVRNGYQKYFLDIFIENSDDNKNCSDPSTCNIKEVINYYNKKYSTGKEECEEIYSSYLEAKDKFDKDNSDKIKKGLFMIMKCTPEGWIVEGNPSCKKRCSGEKTVHVNPDGLGDYYVTIKVADLRHSKNTGSIQIGARRSQANCSVGNMHAYRYNGASFSCDNSHMSTNLLDDDGGRTSNFKYHSHGLVWKIYCSGTFSAFGIMTQRRADRGGTVSFPYGDSFCWRDHYNKELAVLCPGDKNISTTEGDAKIDCGNRKFDTVTNILYEIDSR